MRVLAASGWAGRSWEVRLKRRLIEIPAVALGLGLVLSGCSTAGLEPDDTVDHADTETVPPDPAPLTVAIDPVTGIRPLAAHASGASDAATWSWTVDGARTLHAGPAVPALDILPGETWEVTVTDTDGRTATTSVVVPAPPGGNILLVILDDVGVDNFNASNVASRQVRTPVLDALAGAGVYFENAYAAPECTPTRAAILTGRHARRTGIGGLIAAANPDELPLDAVTAPEALAEARAGDYTSIAMGKYHLASRRSESGLDAPILQGFSWYAGSNDNLLERPDGYFAWRKSVAGVLQDWTVYATTDTANDAIAQIGGAPEPWFAQLAFNAPHTPIHVPPPELTTVDLPSDAPEDELYGAMLEAVDTELGRVLGALDPEVLQRTTVIVVGDNGTSKPGTAGPFEKDRSKHTMYEGGVHVPLMVVGPLVAAPGRSAALVHVVDIFATIADIAGVPLAPTPTGLALELEDGDLRAIDGVSLLPWFADPALPTAREYVFAELFAPLGPPPYPSRDARTIRDARWKLIEAVSTSLGMQETEFFDLTTSTLDEGQDLLRAGPLTGEQQAAFDRLSAALDAQIAALPYDGF